MIKINYKLTFILCAFFLFAQNNSISSQVISHWDFNSGTSNVLPDVSGNGHDGVIENSSWEVGHLCFNGVNSEVNVESDPSLSGMNQLTIISKVKFNEVPEVGEYSRIIGVFDEFNGFNSSTQQAYNLGIASTAEGTKLIFTVRTGSSTGYDGINLYSLIETFPINEWIEIHAIFDNGYMALYIDGELIIGEEFYTSATINEAETPLTIGYTIGTNNNNDPLNTHLNGCIDDLILYNSVVMPQPGIEGLVAYYPFNGNANDESGNGNDGIVNGATLTTDRFGNENSAYSFDGGDDYIHIPYSEDFNFDPSGQFTLVAWANTNVLDVSHHIITKAPSNTVWDYGLTIDNNNLYLFGHHSQHEAYSTTQAQTNSWHMVVGVYDNANWKIYIDGVLENDNTASSITQSSGGIAIGRKGETELGYFNGKIDDVSIYSIVLSQFEIDSIYHEDNWPIVDGLVAHYPFNSNANDESGNGNDGTVNGATLTTDRFGNENSAYSFDGVDDYIHIPYSEDFNFDPSGQFTLVAWTNTNVLDVSHHIVTKAPSNTVWDYGLTIDNNNLYLFGHHANHEAYSTTQAVINSWHLVVGVYGNSNWKIYIDGVLETDNTATSITQSSGGIAIGRKGETGLGYFNGKIDDVSIYNIALSQYEIDSIYHEGDWPLTTEGLVAHYPFNSNANDESGNGNDGIVNGATLTTDRFGNENSAYSFDGVNDNINCGHNSSQSFSDQLTMIAWVNTNSQSDVQFIFSKWGGPNANESFYLALDETNTPYGKINFTDTQEIVPKATNSIGTGAWHWLAMTYNKDSALYYVDNEIVDVVYDNREILSGTLPLMIGDDNGNNLRFSGIIDDCRLYNVALTPSEINALYDPFVNVIATKSDNHKLNIFPNPNNGVFNINLQKNTENDIFIYSLDGKLVFNNRFMNSCELNLITLEKGIYLVKVISKGFIETKKLIIE